MATIIAAITFYRTAIKPIKDAFEKINTNQDKAFEKIATNHELFKTGIAEVKD